MIPVANSSQQEWAVIDNFNNVLMCVYNGSQIDLPRTDLIL